MKFNLNDRVKVKLTADAIEQLRTWYCELGIEKHFVEPEKDDEGFSEFQLWQVMQYFGTQMYNGNPRQMFEKNEMIYLGGIK